MTRRVTWLINFWPSSPLHSVNYIKGWKFVSALFSLVKSKSVEPSSPARGPGIDPRSYLISDNRLLRYDLLFVLLFDLEITRGYHHLYEKMGALHFGWPVVILSSCP